MLIPKWILVGLGASRAAAQDLNQAGWRERKITTPRRLRDQLVRGRPSDTRLTAQHWQLKCKSERIRHASVHI
ncbi:hypothetical protein B0H11DRAFT_1973695 [Mycena galericulata]|nr:hypothetical protein B0H11DRAFT_1973695 [Mycena galericulata]